MGATVTLRFTSRSGRQAAASSGVDSANCEQPIGTCNSTVGDQSLRTLKS